MCVVLEPLFSLRESTLASKALKFIENLNRDELSFLNAVRMFLCVAHLLSQNIYTIAAAAATATSTQHVYIQMDNFRLGFFAAFFF